MLHNEFYKLCQEIAGLIKGAKTALVTPKGKDSVPVKEVSEPWLEETGRALWGSISDCVNMVRELLLIFVYTAIMLLALPDMLKDTGPDRLFLAFPFFIFYFEYIGNGNGKM